MRQLRALAQAMLS
jgi:hypothetical protein